jgi:hypothetical protein
MVCEHLRELERELLLSGIKVTFRGQAWSDNCREWVYFDAFLDTSRIRERYQLSSVVRDHTHRGTHDGEEHGLVCSACHDALVGFLEPKAGKAIFPLSP